MQTVYFISGLGADERAFSFLNLSFCNPVFVKWVKPLLNESIQAYAARLKQQIPDKQPVIVGLSFGGMMSMEIAKQFPCKKVILLASAKTEKEIPVYMKLMRYLPFHKLASPAFLRAGNHFAYRLMRIHNRADKILFTKMLSECDDDFMKWAIHQIINWKNRTIPPNTIHIHGTKDIMLPHYFIKADHLVKGGEHLMVINKPSEIEDLLKKILLDIK
jgi:pimeloyl-ACP methyl ester carboxylesterase